MPALLKITEQALYLQTDMRGRIYIEIFVATLLILLGLVLHIKMLDLDVIRYGDFDVFISQWMGYMERKGMAVFTTDFSDYTPPYLYALNAIVQLGLPWHESVKVLSGIFDYLCAFAVGMICKESGVKNGVMWGLAIVPLLPTVLINSMWFAQCDAIYTSFVLWALYFAMRERRWMTVVMLGLAFSIKLQTILVAPFFFVLLMQTRFKVWHFLVIPAVYIVMIVPAWLSGGDFVALLTTYFRQAAEYMELQLNFPNIYLFFGTSVSKAGVRTVGVLTVVFLTLLSGWLLRKKEWAAGDYPFMALTSIVLVSFILPGMHERYMYSADVLAVGCAIINWRYIAAAVGIEMVSLIAYGLYVFRGSGMMCYVGFTIFVVAIIILVIADKNMLGRGHGNKIINI